jgi:hypothetical protein
LNAKRPTRQPPSALVEALRDADLNPRRLDRLTRTFAFVGGVTAMAVSDNLKSGIPKACFYEPAVNRSYVEMAAYYDQTDSPPANGATCDWRPQMRTPASRSSSHAKPNDSDCTDAACRALLKYRRSSPLA